MRSAILHFAKFWYVVQTSFPGTKPWKNKMCCLRDIILRSSFY